MLFHPKSSKFKKYQKGTFPNRLKNICALKSYNNTRSIKLVTNEFGNITAKQLTAIRFLIRKFIKKKGILQFKVFPQRSVTKKPAEIRMGKGKGSFSFWSANLKQGALIFEIFCRGIHKKRILNVLKRVQMRLPLKTLIYS